MEGKHKKMMKSASMSKRERSIETIDKGNSSRFPVQLLFPMIGPFHPVECDGFSRHFLYDFSSHGLLGLVTQADVRNEKELHQLPMSRMTSPIGVRTSKLNRSSARSKMTFSWITEQDGCTQAHMRS
jgi:hypothetical protein